MRIIDKNVDFYDYLQGVYPDNTTTFDRTDSFVLTKKDMCDYLRYWQNKFQPGDNRFVLLQICNTYWLFLCEITKTDQHGQPKDFDAELLVTWKKYETDRTLIKLEVITFGSPLEWRLRSSMRDLRYDRLEIRRYIESIMNAINTADYKIIKSIDKYPVYYGGIEGIKVYKHIPLLKASGFAQCLDAQDVYFAFDEYFSLEKTASERTTSSDITDNEKATNHGFDTKTSFRGKRRKG